MSDPNRKARIVLAGAGHCHAEVLRRSKLFTSRGHSVTVISPDLDHVYSGMAPGLLAGSWSRRDASLPVAELARRGGVEFIQDRVTGLDPAGKAIRCRDHSPIRYDVLSVNLGSETTLPASSETRMWPSKPVRSLVDAAARLESLLRERTSGADPVEVAVVGGGFSGIELAANAASFLGDRGVVTIYTRALAPSLTDHPPCMRYVRRALDRLGIRVREGVRVDPTTLVADVVLVATGITPPAVLREFNVPLAPDGALPVDRFLRVSGEEDVFAVGDCATFLPVPLPRVGVFAVRQQPVLIHNLLARAEALREAGGLENNDTVSSLTGHQASHSDHGLISFQATGPYLRGMNLGPRRGLLFRGRWVLTGAPAWHLKALIDRGFIRRYR